MSEPKAPSPRAVSAFLGREFQRFTQGRAMPHEGGWIPVYPGFKVQKGHGKPWLVKHVAVEHVLGSRDEHLLPARQKEITQARLARYQKHLEQRYRVTRNNEDDPGDWNVLLVWTKGEGE